MPSTNKNMKDIKTTDKLNLIQQGLSFLTWFQSNLIAVYRDILGRFVQLLFFFLQHHS